MIKKALITLALLPVSVYLLAFTAMGSNPDQQRMQKLLQSPQYNVAELEFQNPRPIETFSGDRSMWDVMSDFWFAENQRRPETRLPESPPLLSELQHKSEQVRFIWFGHSTIMLDIDQQRIMLDPIFSNYASPIPGIARRFQAPVFSIDEIPDIDVVVISHDHYDHLDYQTIEQLKGRNIQFIVPLGVGAHLEYWGIEADRIIELDWWQETRYQGIRYTATPAQHFSGRGLFNRNSTLWASWAIQGRTQNLYFSGDSGYSSHYKEIGDRLGPFDFAFLENGAYNLAWQFVHQLPEEGVQASIDLRSKAMIPIHWAMFDLSIHSWHEPIERVSKEAERRGVILITPQLGQLVNTSQSFKFVTWWTALIQLIK